MEPIDLFLEIDKNEELYHYKVLKDTIHLWPMVRYEIIFAALYEKEGISNPYDPVRIKCSHAFSYFRTTWKERSSKACKHDFIFFGSDVSNIKAGEKYFNRLTEYFANQYMDKSILIEQSSNFSYKRPRTYQKVFVLDDILIKSKLFGKVIFLHRKDLNTIRDFMNFLENKFPWNFRNTSFWNHIEKTLIRLCKEYKVKYLLYEKLFNKIKPKIVFLDGASYGYANLAIVNACKDKNIVLAEYQHGLISLNHPAYNYHNEIPAIYNKYLPDYFLSYGNYWKNNSRLPIPILNIGNPYLTQKVGEVDLSKKENQLLYASGGIEPEICVKNLLTLNEKLLAVGYKVVFRPHPNETHRLNTIYKPLKDNGITIDLGVLYESLSKSKYVFSDFSTVLFEAIAFKCIPVVLRTSGSDMNINYNQIFVLDSVDDIVALVLQNRKISDDIGLLWQNDWKNNFRNFINDITGL